ncbi:hypothetical protein EDD37DRAFT_632442 [Exophiala viscosa]|uniref:uncharacterized protein n=1 Tax=Exophiala viscosa TaxID=2486360 RepID=UPI0021A00221|nr:hypothetical protein EDD37DRAFT_632442 [Exophiala viscosa]
MEARLEIDSAGREFDQWLDWNGSVNNSSRGPVDERATIAPENISHLPISPSSSTNGDVHLSLLKTDLLTAPSQHELLTPRHSSGSPDSRSSMEMRLSGDTLREAVPSIERPMLKRKLSPSDVPITDSRYDAPTPAAKKRPHNIIEKRYRANLNDKIAELRDSVPSLRTTKKSKTKDSVKEDSDEQDLDGLSPSNKLNKASILTKAVEYIRHLEFRTKRLEEENKSLKERLETLDKVIAQGGHDAQRAAAFTSDTVIEQTPSDSHPTSPSSDSKQTSSNPPQGLISLPDSWRRLRQNQSQEHYGHIYDTPSNRSKLLKGKWPTRVMLGSLAGLMIIDGLNESDTGTESREKGLFGIPLELLDGWQFLQSPKVYLAAFSQFCQAGGVFPLIKGFVALTIVAFLVFSYLFNSKPGFKQDIEEAGPISQAPAPASPIEVRRRAWSTSMQELRLPHHSFFPEWLALTSEWLKYTVGCLFGPRAYAWLTGRTAEDDVARIKAWDIAIDAQLAGGDVEVSRSRVVLTIFGSGTLPSTPLRLMLKALHCRVLLWNVGSFGTAVSRVANRVGKFLACRQWSRAKETHDNLPLHHTDRLPTYLSEMLEMPCDDVVLDTVCQRAYNLMYDRPTQENASNALMDVVVEDHAVRSPLDAIAAWRSTYSLTRAVELSLQDTEPESLQQHLSCAVRLAPPGSAVELRALAASSVFSSTLRSACFPRASKAMEAALSPTPAATMQPPYFIDSSTPVSARTDILNCLHCAKTLQILECERDEDKAVAYFCSRNVDTTNANLLSKAAVACVLRRLPAITSSASADREEVRILPRDFGQEADSLPQRSMEKSSRRYSTLSNDTGYESQDDLTSSGGLDRDVRLNGHETLALASDEFVV